MQSTARGARVVLVLSAMMASIACGGRSATGHLDASVRARDANLVAMEDDAADALLGNAPEATDTQAATAETRRLDGGDAQSSAACTQAHRSSAPCPSSQWYLFQGDQRCFLCASSAEPGCSSSVSHWCMSWGDGLCYLRCQSNADCTDPCFPFCRKLSLYGGNEHCGASSQSVCLRGDRDTCDPSAEQL